MSGLTAEQQDGIVLALLDPGFDCAHNFELVFDYVAALIAEAVEQARADVAEQAATAIKREATRLGTDYCCRSCAQFAARIARGEVTP